MKKILVSVLVVVVFSALFVSCKKSKEKEIVVEPKKNVETTVKIRNNTIKPGMKGDKRLQEKEVLKKLIKRKKGDKNKASEKIVKNKESAIEQEKKPEKETDKKESGDQNE
jgi:hypothetical protein